jgi:hypothetical protein
VHDKLNAEMMDLEGQIKANRIQLRQLKCRAKKSRDNRKEQLVGIEKKIDALEEDPILPQDTYSFFAIAKTRKGCPELSLGLAIFVLVLQVVTLTFLALDVVDRENYDNPLGMPPGVDWTVQVCQLIALFITVITQDEVRVSLNVLVDGYPETEAAFGAIGCKDTSKAKWFISAILRLFAGMYSLLLTFILIITSNEVRDLLLNFTAVEFISNVDDTIFLLSTWGYFGPRALKDANKIVDAKAVKSVEDVLRELAAQEHAETRTNVKQDGTGGSASTIDTLTRSMPNLHSNSSSDATHNSRCRCSRRALFLMAIWFIMFIAWTILSVQQGEGEYLPETIYVQFGDERMTKLGTFSGHYTRQRPKRLIFGERKKYIDKKSGGKFQYCKDKEIWTFSFGEGPNKVVPDPCDTGSRFVRAHSGKSNAFDLTRKPLDTWYYGSFASNTTQQVPLEQISIDEPSKDCGSFGTYSESTKQCICNDTWFGENCGLGSCQAMAIIEGAFNDTIEWSKQYRILKKGGSGTPVQVYGRPVFVGQTRQGDTDVIFFTGRRWVLTHTGRFVVNGTRPEGTPSRSIDVASFFSRNFHGHWANYTVSFVSEAVGDPVIFDYNNKAAIPTGLVWYHSNNNNDDILSPNVNTRSDAVLACTCAVNATLEDGFQCENDGTCEDGTCRCVEGSSGERCEISGKGNGLCNRNFNTQEGGFDGGDCCSSTCSGGDYLCGLNEEGDYIGFPHCKDKSQLENGVCDLSLNTAENMWDGGDCCEDTCIHPYCGRISESVLGGRLDVGYPFCHRDPKVICPDSESCVSWTNISIVLQLGSQHEDAGFHFRCGDRLIADSSAGDFNEQQRRTGTLVVRDGAPCNLQVKGNHTNGRFRAYYGHTSTSEDVLMEDVEFSNDKNITFTVSRPSMVDIVVWARHDNSTRPTHLGLSCKSELQTHNESLRELDFEGSGEALETARVRSASWCQFDERGKEEYELFFEKEKGASIFRGKRRDGERTKVFFQAVSPVDVVRIVALVEPASGTSQIKFNLRCRRDSEIDAINYTAEVPFRGSVVLRHVYVVPKRSQCLFTVTDSSADSISSSYQLLLEGNSDPLWKSEIAYSRESVFFDPSLADGAAATTILYDGRNEPGAFAFDLKCNASFPQDLLTGETRSVVLLPNESECSFTMSTIALDLSDPLCSRGEGFFRVYDGLDTSTDRLLTRGPQIEDEPVSFVTGSLQPLLPFVASVQFNRTSELNDTYEDTQLNVKCDNALKVDKVFADEVSSDELSFQVREGASCELTFVDLNNTGRFQLHSTLGNGSTVLEGGGSDGGDRFLFMASSLPLKLVPVTIVIDWNARTRETIDDISLRMKCSNITDVYFMERGDTQTKRMGDTPDLKTFETFLVPEGIECEMMIVNIGNEKCCNDDKVNFEVKAGNKSIVKGEFGCRVNSSFTAVDSAPEAENLGLRALLQRLISG